MIAFLNERSLGGNSDWCACLKFFLGAAEEMAGANGRRYRDGEYFRSGEFARRFNSLSFSSDIRAVLRGMVFTDRYYECWRPNRVSDSTAEYVCDGLGLSVFDESIGEASERLSADGNLHIFAVCAADSMFAGRERLRIACSKWGEKSVELSIATALDAIRAYKTRQRGYYDRQAEHTPPHDFQTILEKHGDRFVRTNKWERHGNRKVFREIQTNWFYCVDSGHFGPSAHLEVFSADCEHLGIADIDTGALDESRRIPGRYLRW